MSGGATPAAEGPPPPVDDRDMEPRTPMKRLGSTRKLAAFNNIRVQLGEQTRVLEARAEASAGVAGELHEYCRRRAELEHEYARALDKLARAALQRDRDQRHRREPWALAGAAACWRAALAGARALARDHAALADLYAGPLAARTQRAADDAQRLHRKCKDIVAERHDEVAAALADAAAHGKLHAHAHADWRAAALKLKHAHDQRADPPRHKKIKALDKDLDKRRARHAAARAAALRARAEYALSLEAANATLQRYYLDDVADIILCMEVGFDAVIGRVSRAAAEAEAARGAAAGGAAAALRLAADALDPLADRQRLLEAHAQAFALPRPLPAPEPDDDAAPPGAEPDAAQAEAGVRAELEQRLRQLEDAARKLRAECRENAKTLDAAEAELVKQMEGADDQWEVASLFGAGAAGGGALAAAPPPPLDDQEDYYLAKFRSYAMCAGRLARVESKAAALRGRLGAAGAAPVSPPRRAARPARGVFAAPLDARLPRVLTECVRVIATYGLRHQGLFRVSGSVLEMAALRAAFERGEEPLAGARDASDVNSVCGLLKLFLREVRPPLLPPQLQERLLRIAALPDDAAFVSRLRATLTALPLPAVLVLRYLFAFLAHLAEHAQHTMMDAWNLAICVGPTLLAAWGEGPHQLAAQNLVNELVKRTILHHADVFPQDVAPEALYRRPASDAPGPTDAPGPPDTPDAPDTPGPDTPEPDTPDTPGPDMPAPDERADSGEEAAADPDTDTEEESSDEGDSGAWLQPDDSLAATPDLVLDLPARAAADAFAHNRDTVRKKPAGDRPPAGAAGAAGAAGGSPVPARNTQRVAAKFAELTLTGGSLKPALAAKPALLRRPPPPPRAPKDP